MKMIHLSKKKVLKAARKAYLAGKLSMQGPTPACQYLDPSGHPCVIGAALTPEERKQVMKDKIGSVQYSGYFSYPSRDKEWLVNLQAAHDNTCNSAREDKVIYENRVRQMLEIDV